MTFSVETLGTGKWPNTNPELKDTRDIAQLDLTVRAYHTLRRNGIYTISELYAHTETDLLQFNNFGAVSLRDVRDCIRTAGLPALRVVNRGRCPHCGVNL